MNKNKTDQFIVVMNVEQERKWIVLSGNCKPNLDAVLSKTIGEDVRHDKTPLSQTNRIRRQHTIHRIDWRRAFQSITDSLIDQHFWIDTTNPLIAMYLLGDLTITIYDSLIEQRINAKSTFFPD